MDIKKAFMKNRGWYLGVIIIFLGGIFLFLHPILGHSSRPVIKATAFENTLGNIKSIERGIEYAHGLFRENPQHITAFINQENLIFKDSGGQVLNQIPLPKDKFYLAIAPYKQHMRDCTIHYLNSSKAEMPGRIFDVKISDKKTRKMVLQEKTTTLDNGFFEIFLDKAKNYFIEISDESGATATGIISTFENSKTCITDLKLR